MNVNRFTGFEDFQDFRDLRIEESESWRGGALNRRGLGHESS
jgi:hypothetical protein